MKRWNALFWYDSETVMTVLALSCAFVALLVLPPASAFAQDLHVVAEGVAEPEALMAALSEDLRRPVTAGSETPPILRITLLAEGRARLRFTALDGSVRERTAQVATDPRAAVAELALLGSNLVRDEASALIAEAAETATVAVTPGAPPPGAPAALVVAQATPVEQHFALARPLRLGVAAIGGIHPRDGEVEPFFDWGLSLFGSVHEAISFGVTRLNVGFGFSSIEGTIFHFSGAPALELFLFPDRHVQLYGQVGVNLQGRTPDNLQPGIFQAAPFLAAGARFWIVAWSTISVQLAIDVTVTENYRMGGIDLPQWSTPGTLGLSAEFHFDP